MMLYVLPWPGANFVYCAPTGTESVCMFVLIMNVYYLS